MTGPRIPTTMRRTAIRRWTGRMREGRGSGSVWAIGVVAVVALLAGAVLDGGNAMAARVQALDIAQQAARAGANQLDLGALRNQGVVRLDPGAARAAAEAFLREAGATGTATATIGQVSVMVTRSEPTLMLQAIGVDSIDMTATAVPQTGP
jgi:Putative Flp pilus-assembly TadE/G-like